jgi:hypothetical protein
MIGVLSRDGKTELLWQDGHKVVHEDPNQVRLPGMARGKRGARMTLFSSSV